MNPTLKKTITKAIDKLHVEGLQAAQNQPGRGLSPVHTFEFVTQCRNLITLLGTAGEPFKATFEQDPFPGAILEMVGTLAGIKASIQRGLLEKAESLILADAFDNLLGQAQYLFDNNYFLAAGVIGRAVLESHLRKWCDHAGCLPSKQRPTIEDYKGELYSHKHLDKAEMLHVQAMAATGNDAAHAKPTLTSEQIERLLRDLPAFLANHPLP